MTEKSDRTGSGWRWLGEAVPKTSLVVGGVSIALSMVLVVMGVVGRSVFNLSLPFAIEFSEYLIPMACYWGAAYTLSEGGHVNADVVVHRFPERIREWFLYVGYLLGLPYLAVITYQFYKVTASSYTGNYVSMYPLQTPLWYPQLLVWIGLIFFDLQLVVEIIKKTRRLFGRQG